MAQAPILLADGLLACAFTDDLGRFSGFNPGFLDRLGFSATQLHGRYLTDLFDEGLRSEVRLVAARVRAGVPHHVTWRTRTASGAEIHCEWQLTPRGLRGGGTSGLALTLIPLEDQRREWRQLNQAQTCFRSIAAGVAAMVWVAGPDGAIRNSNRAWRDFLGGDYPSPDVWRVVLHPDDYAAVMQLRAGAHAPAPSIATYRLRRHDGTWRWVEERVLRQVADDGEVQLVASCNDVTDQREMRFKLENSIALHEGILNGALDAIITVDERNKIVGFNPAAEQMFGRHAEDILGGDVTTLMPERFRHGHDERVASFALRNAGPRRLGNSPGICGLRADGSEFPIEASVSKVPTPQGYRITAIVRDISSQMRAVQALQDRKERLQLALESANLGSAEIDIATGRTTVSRIAAGLLGLGSKPSDWALPNFLDPVHPEDRPFLQGLFETVVREDRPLDAEFRIIRRHDNAERWLFGRGRLYRNTRGEPKRVVSVMMDITDRKHNEAQLRRLSQRLLAVQEDERRHIARELHDQIGQALTAALINLQMLPADATGGPVQELQQSLAAVLGQVRELSLNLRPSMLDSLGLEPALRWYLDRQAALGKFKVELLCPDRAARLPAETETVVFRLVQEALTNILRHARAKHVWVSVERSGEEAVLSVRDDGVGFDRELVMSRAGSGMSFGVLGMRERAELAGGTLNFRSQPGEGTLVTAVLPVK